jgi:hypothetical protein
MSTFFKKKITNGTIWFAGTVVVQNFSRAAARRLALAAMFARLTDAFKRKKDATKFEVTLRLHTLSPWPAAGKFKRLGVRWQRGGKVRCRCCCRWRRLRTPANSLPDGASALRGGSARA